jgi:NAD dependent epimerase/dehydratase family enzyme
MRISLVMGKSGGVYPVLRRLAKFGLAGKMGIGKQRFSWVHVKDVVGIVDFLISNESIDGAVNCTAPEVPTNKEIMKELRSSLNIFIGIPQPAFLLKIGGMIVGTESELILGSRWVVPKRLLDNGFEFKFSSPRKALENLA